MIHDALLILWDCSVPHEMRKVSSFGNEGDQEMFGRICEIAKSHHRIQNFVVDSGFHARKAREITHWSTKLYSQALSEGIVEIIQAYKQTLIEVESLVIENHTLTLSYIYSHVEKYRGLFNTLNRMISTIKEKRISGCQILSLVHQHILTGNELVHEAILKVFSNVNKVFLNQLCNWVLYGDLKDPYQEFFIYKVETKNVPDTTSASSNTNFDKTLLSSLQETECGFNINPVMIPHYMPLSLAQEILFIGKTVILFGFDPRKNKKRSQFSVTKQQQPLKSFLNKCADIRRFTIWGEKESIFHDKLQGLKGVNFEIMDLRIVVHEIKECVSKHLWVAVVEEAQLIHELQLMKDFYLLGRGELFLELLRLSAHLLDGPTTWTSTRDINHAFQLAARAVFLSNSADIEKFSLELPYVKPVVNVSLNLTTDSEVSAADGWSCILLKYHFRWPLHLIFTPEVLARYNDMFRLLLRIKKTQHDLHALWNTYKHASSFQMCQLHNKLMFLMDNLQHYLQADVLETNFSKFMEVVGACDFEKLKQAHATFLADVLSQSFLTVTTTTESDRHTTDTLDGINNPVFCNIMELLKLCHSFCSMSVTVNDKESEDYYIRGYTERFNKLVKQLMQLLVSFREHPCGIFLARLLMRLDYNRWLSGEAQLTQSVTNMLSIVG